MSVLTIRDARESDVPQLVDIHQAALPDDFLPRLGHKFLATIFFPLVLNTSAIRVLVLENKQSILSVMILSRSSSSLTKLLLSKKVQVGLALLNALIKNPAIFFEMISHLCGVKRQFLAPYRHNFKLDSEIWLIATRPEDQGKGYGAMILDHALPVDEKIVAKTSSKEAESFYRKFGFIPIGTEARGSRSLQILLLDRRPQNA
jgi:hypothetical protein